MTPAGYQEAETVNQPLMAAQQINEAPEGLVELEKHTTPPHFLLLSSHLYCNFENSEVLSGQDQLLTSIESFTRAGVLSQLLMQVLGELRNENEAPLFHCKSTFSLIGRIEWIRHVRGRRIWNTEAVQINVQCAGNITTHQHKAAGIEWGGRKQLNNPDKESSYPHLNHNDALFLRRKFDASFTDNSQQYRSPNKDNPQR